MVATPDGFVWLATAKGLFASRAGKLQKIRDADFRCLFDENGDEGFARSPA